MDTRTLPNPWNFFNLQASPYWQDPLGDGDATHPLSLFVGRQAELKTLLDGLMGAGSSSSRRAVAGSPGVGKTTLVKQFKAAALSHGYFTTDGFVPVVSGETTEGLFGRVLGAVYDTVLANRPATIDNAAMQAAQVLVRAARERLRGGGFSLAGVGASASQSITTTSPRDMLIDGPRVLRDLLDLVAGSDARGVLVHINNFENLSESDTQRAGVVLRDLRDLLLMHSGLHVIVVGTPDAIQAAVMSQPQVRTTFSILSLPSLETHEVLDLLAERYAHLRLDPAVPVVPPVEPDAVRAIYALFRGDLRGLLKALEDGVTPNIGLVDGIRSLTFDELRGSLQRAYTAELGSLSEEQRVAQLVAWGTSDPDAMHTQKSLKALWDISQPAVSQALAFLGQRGYVTALPRQGATPIQYALSGVSRLIFA